MLKAGIVGLPNVGKSTLFNAVLRAHKAPAENYPFCTIDPNLGVVTVPDPRLEAMAGVVHVATRIPTTFEFVDIAGLVKGASQGQGLGNKFLSHIREVDAIIQVIRCFEDPDVVHVDGSVDPVRDMEIVTTELILADLDTVKKRQEKIGRDVKRGDKHAVLENVLLERVRAHLDAGQPALTLPGPLALEERSIVRGFYLLTDKPTLFVANVKEGDLADPGSNVHAQRVRDHVASHHSGEALVLGAQLESDLIDLAAEEAEEYRRAAGVTESGVANLIHAAYHALGLRTFFTFNEQEVRAWTVPAGSTAPQAAGRIHTDFEKGFIKAETVKWADLVRCGSVGHAREKGLYRIEGKDYVVQDGDVLLFRFHN